MSCKAPAHKFKIGTDDLEYSATHTSYGIDVHFANTTGGKDTHWNQIVVYGDPDLRDKIIELLNKDNEDLSKTVPDNG